MTDGYLTVAGRGEAETVDKQSRFLGHIVPVSCEAEARAFIGDMRRQYADATHNVYAYLLREGGVMRWSDDGEPGGTSGQPTLGVLQGAGILDVCCVITRYFGGILLGSGGLVRAYSNAARKALEAAGLVRMRPWQTAEFRCGYAQYEKLRRALEDRGARIENAFFAEQVDVVYSAPQQASESLRVLLRDLTAGSVVPNLGDRVFRPEKV